MTLFIQPVQIATEVLNEAQNAIAGWRRVLDVLDIDAGRRRPGASGGSTCRPGRSTCGSPTSHFAYPGRRPGRCSPTSTSTIAAQDPGRGGRARPARGKTTFAKLLTRLMDPTAGAVLLVRRAADRGAVRLAALAGW